METITDILIKIYIQFAIPLAITVALGATAIGKDDELMNWLQQKQLELVEEMKPSKWPRAPSPYNR